MPARRVFRSRIDAALVLLMLVSLVIAASVIGMLLTRVPAFPGQGLVIAVLVGMVTLVLWLLLSTRYIVDAVSLAVHSGPFCWTIVLTEIHAISSTRDPRSAPALSLQRLRIDYGAGRRIMISPREEAQFLAELHARGVGVSAG